MANKYANLVGTNKIKDEYSKINTGFDKVEADINDANSRITAVDNRLDTIITTPIDDEAAAQELVDARAGFSTIGDRMTKIEENIETHKADYVSIKRFGAKGDGVTDDTQSIRDAITYIKTDTNGGLLFIPRGQYIITDTIVIDSNISFIGEGSDGSDADDGMATRKAISEFKWGVVDTGKPMLSIVGNVGGISWSNFCINGYYDNTHYADGILIDRLVNSTFSNITFFRCNNALIMKPITEIANDNTMQNVFSKIEFYQCKNGLLLDGNEAHTSNCCHNTFINVDVNFFGDYGIYLSNCDNNTFVTARTYRRSGVGTGVRLGTSSRSNYFYHLQSRQVVAETGSKNVIFGFDRANGQQPPVVEGNAYLTWTEDCSNANFWNIGRPISQPSIGVTNPVRFQGRSIKHTFSTSANLAARTPQVLIPSGAPAGITGVYCPLPEKPFAFSLTLTGFITGGSFTVEIKDASTNTVLWSETIAHPSGNNKFFKFAKSIDFGSPEAKAGHVLSVTITPDANITPATLQAYVEVYCAI